MAWKVIKPKPLNTKAINSAARKALKAVGEGFKDDFDATTKTWDREVVFETTYKESKSSASVTVATDDEIYRYVNDGTEAHIIRPKNARILRFASGYTAKTSPGTIGSSTGGSFGASVVARVVRHPGTKARKFDEAILEKWQDKLADELGIVVSVFREESGHAI